MIYLFLIIPATIICICLSVLHSHLIDRALQGELQQKQFRFVSQVIANCKTVEQLNKTYYQIESRIIDIRLQEKLYNQAINHECELIGNRYPERETEDGFLMVT